MGSVMQVRCTRLLPRQVRKVESIIRSDARRRFLCLQRLGNAIPAIKITDLLYTCHQLAEHGLSFAEPIGSRPLSGACPRAGGLDPAGGTR